MSAVWAPRLPHPDEPACWSWPVPPLTGLASEYRRRLVTYGDGQFDHFMDALVGTSVVESTPAGQQFNAFHAGRCAICGGYAGVDDHCHETGQTRGRLCDGGDGCNLREGRSIAPIFIRYRRIHPAKILGYYELYHGIGWARGYRIGDDAWLRGNRPFTPWPDADPDDPVEDQKARRKRLAAARRASAKKALG